MLALAMATIPSPRPVKPSCSLVVALMATRLVEMPQTPPMAAFMASTCGPTRGASQTMVMSRLTIRPRRSPTRPAACLKKIEEAAPFHCGSEGGKCLPISPSPNAP